MNAGAGLACGRQMMEDGRMSKRFDSAATLPKFAWASMALLIALFAAAAPAQITGYPAGAVRAPQLPHPGRGSGITWINSPPLSMKQLRGQVVLVDFWEYTCINCIRTLDTNKRWYRLYHRYGFTILGVHDPEFDIAFEGKDARRFQRDPRAAVAASHGTSKVDNVRRAVRNFGLAYPVVVDDFFKIWRAYDNQYWPNRFLIDARGYLRYNVIGEGGDGPLEAAIQRLLREAHPGLKFPGGDAVHDEAPGYGPGCGDTTAEMYIGNWEGRGVLVNAYHPGKTHRYRLPARIADGRAGLSGSWQTDRNGMIYRGRGQPGPQAGRLAMRYHAREIYAVLNVAHGHPERVYLLQDGRALPKTAAGEDVRYDAHGRSYIFVRASRLYYLATNPAIGEHRLELLPTAPGFTVNSFTFGNNCQLHFSHLKG